MDWLPISLKIAGATCVVIGGGELAARKVRQLRAVGGLVRVIAPELNPELRELHEAGAIDWHARTFADADTDNCVLVIAATDDREVNGRVSDAAHTRRVPVNVVDDPARCSFIMPSVVDRDPVSIAISTGGASPVLARLLRARIETLIPASFGRLAELMRGFRDQARARFPELRARRRFWEQILQGPVAEMLHAGQERAAFALLKAKLDDPEFAVADHGEVYLVGGGPGDPDLLTFRALRLLQQADTVLYDRLVAPAIVDLCRKDAERIFVGKQSDRHELTQQDINQLLIRLARDGKRVARLKGGDPFIFGRGGEEIEQLAAAGIPFQIVPGITAASGCAAYAGIPLTHRELAHSCVFVTGHLKDGKLDLNWAALVQPRQTIAVYMAVAGSGVLCEELIRHGMAPATPVAVIQQGTTPEQKVYVSTLAGLPDLVKREDIKPPSMTIVGEVVKLHETLAWYEGR